VIGLPVGVIGAMVINQRMQPLYAARMILDVGIPINVDPSHFPKATRRVLTARFNREVDREFEHEVSRVARLARSPKVMVSAGKRLAYNSMWFSPKELLSTLSVEPIEKSSRLALQVASPSPGEAKDAVEVVAAELRKAYHDHPRLEAGEMNPWPSLGILEPAYVYPLDQHKAERVVYAAVLSTVLSILAGLVISWLLPGPKSEELTVVR
jgi:hypothetical protein